MKKLFLTLIIALCAVSFSYAQFDMGFGSDISIIKTGTGDSASTTKMTMATVNLGGYIFINDSWYGIYRPVSFSLGLNGNDMLLSINYGLGFGAKWQINEENSIIGGIAPVLTYLRYKSDSVSGDSPSAFFIGGALDAHYQYEPFADENISFAFIVGAKAHWSPFAFLNTNDSYEMTQLISIKPYAGMSIRFDTSRNNYVMNGPGF